MLLINGQQSNGQRCDLLLINGKIHLKQPHIPFYVAKQILQSFTDKPLECIDLNGYLVMPGVIDVHTHMREPGLTHKEGFFTGSQACAKGGITTFIDMPNTLPPTTTIHALTEKRQLAQATACVNYGFHFGGSKQNNSIEIKQVAGVASTKIFLNASTGDLLITDEDVLRTVIAASRIICFHAEEKMIDIGLQLTKEANKPVYFCHVSSATEMQRLIAAKKEVMAYPELRPVYIEVTPHHLFLTETLLQQSAENALLYRMKPELKSEKDSEFLWQCIEENWVDTIATDHAPHLLSEKLNQLTFGVPGVETSLALMLTAVHEGKISLHQLEILMSRHPADIFHLSHKGQLIEGFDADIIAIDPQYTWQFNTNEVVSKCGWSPFEGWTLTGKTMLTLVGGMRVYQNGQFFAHRGKEVTIYE